MYWPPNSQFVFIEYVRLVGCPAVRITLPTSPSSGSAATPAPPIRLTCSTVRREIRRLAAGSRSSGVPPACAVRGTVSDPPGGGAWPFRAGAAPGLPGFSRPTRLYPAYPVYPAHPVYLAYPVYLAHPS